MVVQGTATVVMDSGHRLELHLGVMVVFERGQGSTWTIVEHFRKAFHAGSPDGYPSKIR